ncbi:MAG TPA: hypothetical protein VLE43_06775 [Candidatus Saccharimonadia bacterium]|nr:hypothetical protein [Candidatus Saccharimonadia bacterium]
MRRFLLSEGWGEGLAPTMRLSTVPGRHHCSLLEIGGEGID